MRASVLFILVLLFVTGGSFSCSKGGSKPDPGPEMPTEVPEPGEGEVEMVSISLSGSIQNPAWSPDGESLLFTRWRGGYNSGPADLAVVDLEKGDIRTIVSNDEDNVNLPGSCWNETTSEIIFSSTRDGHDEIYTISDVGNNGSEVRVTNRPDQVAFEPSFSPDGQWVVFESHEEDVEGNGIIIRSRLSGSGSYEELTDSEDDCRQPNWSPRGDLIVYQKFENDQWDLWLMNTDGSGKKRITTGEGDKTDASFSPDGEWVIYSSDGAQLDFANLFAISISGGSTIRVTNHSDGYDGAPSWSPDGNIIAFESIDGDPDNSTGTKIWLVGVPATLK